MSQAPEVVDIMSHEDRGLIERAQNGDIPAFERLARQHEHGLLRLILAITGNREDAEDALQETLLRAYRSLPSYRGEASVGTWFHRIALNTTRNWIRSQSRASATRMGDRMLTVGAPSASDASVLIETEERRAAIRQAMLSLPTHYRDALVLRHYRDLPYEEIAAVLEVPIGTVRSRIAQGRSILLRKLAAMGYP